MRIPACLLCLLILSASVSAQVAISSDGSSPDASAMLDIKGNNKGLLMPRVSLMNVNSASPLSSPATSLLVYNTNASVIGGSGTGYYSWSGTQWKKLIIDGEGNLPSGSLVYRESATSIPGFTLKGRVMVSNYQEYLGTGSGTWSNIPVISTSNQTSNHTAFWTGTHMLIWSGQDNTYPSYENSGAKYDPVSNGWTSISDVNAPSGRYGNAAAWDDAGKRMLVWGGITAGSAGGAPSAFTNTGGIYYVLTNTWTTINPTGAPSARYYPGAVWTGSRFIVWGGQDNSVYFSDGASFDPGTNTWSPIAAAPISARSNFACVWTGTKMIIWGGENGSGVLNDGAIYDPGSNTWSPISASNAPNGLANTRAVWTGSEMVMVGGYLSSGTESRIYQYDPNANAWDAGFIRLPGSGIIWNGNLSRHAVCWTGTEMIITGGVNFLNEAINLCYRFDPATNVISYYNSMPGTRLEHSAVWSGTQVLVYGGRVNAVSSSTYTGYELDPLTGSSLVYLYPITNVLYLFKKD